MPTNIITRTLTGLALLATLGCSPMGDVVGADHDERSHDLRQPETSAPYCMVDADLPAHQTVAGPAGGWITVDGRDYKALTLVTADDYGSEVAPDAGPFDGILYNVPAGTVAVDGHGCDLT